MKYPSISDLKFNNLYWQVFYTKLATYYLKEAFLDVREEDTKGSYVRILGMVKKTKQQNLYCNLWLNSSESQIFIETKVDGLEYLFMATDSSLDLWPFMMTCRIPNEYSSQIPVSVSLTSKKCEKVSNNIRYWKFFQRQKALVKRETQMILCHSAIWNSF